MKSEIIFISCFFLLTYLISFTNAVSTDEDLTLTYSEKVTLDKFKERVGSKLPHEYMKEDIYLIRWLRAKKFNMDAAEGMLLENIRWRRENNMDTIFTEDWSDLEQDYRYAIEGCDLEGRPVVSAYLGDWNIRKQVVAGKANRLSRYIDKLIEEIVVLIRNSQTMGMNITQFSLILDLSNYNLAQHGCAQCIPVQLHFLRALQQYYAGALHKIMVINTPASFQPVLFLMRPIFSQRAQEILSFYGQNKAEWQAALLKESQKEKLSIPYGGSKETPYEMEHFRKQGYFECEDKPKDKPSKP